MKEMDILIEILKKYDLVLPVSPSEQRRIYRSKRRILAVIIGKGVNSRFMAGAAVRFYYMMRNLGMQVSLASGARAAVFASVFAVLVVAGGSMVAVQDYIYRQGIIAVNVKQGSGLITAAKDLTVTRGTETITEKALGRIKAGDTIITGNASALFQFDTGVIVKVLKQSRVYVASLGLDCRFDLQQGGIISRVPELVRGTGYMVTTPDTVVTVKGTEFGVIYRDGKTKVFAVKGKVHVKHIPSGAEYDINGDEMSEINSSSVINPVSGHEASLVKGFAGLEWQWSAAEMNASEIEAFEKRVADSDSDDNPAGMTLEQMKEKYGKLDVVTLYSGRRLTGVIVSRGSIYKILTVKGVVPVNAKDVKGTKIIQ